MRCIRSSATRSLIGRTTVLRALPNRNVLVPTNTLSHGPTNPGDTSVNSLLRRYDRIQRPEDLQKRLNVAAEDIKKAVKEHEICVFIKGYPGGPCCRFSDLVIQVFSHPFFAQLGLEVHYYDVSRDDVAREAVKIATAWPTIPQIFIQGEFVGGCDILIEMANSEELTQMLQKVIASRKEPIESTGATKWSRLMF